MTCLKSEHLTIHDSTFYLLGCTMRFILSGEIKNEMMASAAIFDPSRSSGCSAYSRSYQSIVHITRILLPETHVPEIIHFQINIPEINCKLPGS